LPDVAVVAAPPLATHATADGPVTAAEIAACLHATTKHLVITGAMSPTTAAALADMAGALRADEADVRRRPPLSLLGGAESFSAAAEFARRGLPAGALVSATAAGPDRATPTGAGDPSPAEVTEALVSYLADGLAANAALQAVAPGAAFVAPVWPALAGLPAAGPAATAFMVGATQVLTRAGLPAAVGAFATAAAGVDWQACSDGAFAVLACRLAGAALLTGAGTLSGGAVFSPRQLVADCEIHSWCSAIAAGISVDDETLAVDAIKQVGVGGNFLGQKHTRRHMKDVWRPRLLDRTSWDVWAAGGRQGAPEKASELARSLLTGHSVDPLDSETAATLERIIATAGL
jgi:trimethylamine--corrinoid protein Co-methyltransferase